MALLLPVLRSLSARLLVHTIVFVMVCELLFFVPALARFRAAYLENRLSGGELAILALEAAPANRIDAPLAGRILARAGVLGVALHRADGVTLMIGPRPGAPNAASDDLRMPSFLPSIADAAATMFGSGNRILRILGRPTGEPDATLEIRLAEEPLRRAMWQAALRMLEMSFVISLGTAALLYLTLQWLLVRPMRRITGAMTAFRAAPEDAGLIIIPSRRNDEIGTAQRALASLQETVRQALRQQARLAALGTAVTKINHDLRGILSTARLISDGLAESAAPDVRRIAPRLLASIDRAVALCTRTLDFTAEAPAPVRRSRFAFAALVDDVAAELGAARPDGGASSALLVNEVPRDLLVEGDRDQLYRVLVNLARNALEAGAQRLAIIGAAQDDAIAIEVSDDGPGLPPKARSNLFQPFTGSARLGGTGLGLAIARELMRAHGGEISLAESTASGSRFRLVLPGAPAGAPVPERAQSAAAAARTVSRAAASRP